MVTNRKKPAERKAAKQAAQAPTKPVTVWSCRSCSFTTTVPHEASLHRTATQHIMNATLPPEKPVAS